MTTLVLERGTANRNWADFVAERDFGGQRTASVPLAIFVDGFTAWQLQESSRRIATGPSSARYNPVPIDLWLKKCLRLLAEYRKYKDDWNGEGAQAPSAESLDTIECLVGLISALPTPSRPQLSLDPLGRPSLVKRSNGKYLHLTVESPGTLTWYACEGDREEFEDEFVFDGSKLPRELVGILK